MRALMSGGRGLPPCRQMLLPTTSSGCPAAKQRRFQSLASRGKMMHDYLYPMPTHLLGALLSDLMPETAEPFGDYSPRMAEPAESSKHLPQGAHLVYFPLLAKVSELASDGADEDHRPPGFQLETPEAPEGGRRLWAGGQLWFHRGWRDRLRVDGRQWVCNEEVIDMQAKGNGEKFFVDIRRRYGLPSDAQNSQYSIDERRTLAFVPREKAQNGSPKSKGIKCPYTPTSTYNFQITPTHVFQFSALSYNAHFIHLDRKDALVQGPFLLAMMMRALEHLAGPTVQHFSYRILAPVKVWSDVTVCVRAPEKTPEAQQSQWDVWIDGPGGNMVARGKAKMEII